MNFLPKNPTETALAGVLAGEDRPAWIIDAQRGLSVATNGRGTAVWGIPVMMPSLDGALPALKDLRARLASLPRSTPSSSFLRTSTTAALKFRTPTGDRMIPCQVHLVDERMGSGLLLVVAEDQQGTRNPIDTEGAVSPMSPGGRAPVRKPPPAPLPRAISPTTASNGAAPLSDAETLREIARRIRQGAAGVANQDSAPEGVDELPLDDSMRFDGSPITAGGDVDSSAPTFDLPSQLAHEIRTPLAAIVSLAEVITEERLGAWPNDRYRGYIRDILDSARHGLDVVDGILRDAANQRAAPVLAEVDLNAEAEAIRTSLQPLVEKSGAQLAAALVSGLPLVTVDRRNVRQMLLNLISNGIKHGGPGVRIKVTTGYELDGSVWVEVEDNGPGMKAANDRSEIGALIRGRQNAGLGLPLTRSLATANGARLDIASRPGRGVRARIVFDPDRSVQAQD